MIYEYWNYKIWILSFRNLRVCPEQSVGMTRHRGDPRLEHSNTPRFQYLSHFSTDHTHVAKLYQHESLRRYTHLCDESVSGELHSGSDFYGMIAREELYL